MEVDGMASLGPVTEPEIDVEAEPEESVEPMVLGEPTASPPADVPVDSEVELGLSPARAPGFWGDIQL